MKALSIAITACMAVWPLNTAMAYRSALSIQTCSDVYSNCMDGGKRSRKSYDSAQQGAQCSRIKAICMKTGGVHTNFLNLDGLKRE